MAYLASIDASPIKLNRALIDSVAILQFHLSSGGRHSQIAIPIDFTKRPTPNVQPIRKYMALGDSFSAGPGAGSSVSPKQSTCGRTDGSYVYQLYQDDDLVAKPTPHFYNETAFGFNACSGAVTTDVQNLQMQNATEPYTPFITGADLYTITVGGNDLGFDEIVRACVYGIAIPFWGKCNSLLNAIDDQVAVNSTFQTNVASLYDSLRAEANGNMVIVLPYITFYNDQVGRGFGCWLSQTTRQRLNQQVRQVNNALRTAAIQRGFQFLNEDRLQAAFDGHRFCDTSTYWIQDSIFDGLSSGAQERWNKNGTLSEEDQEAISNGTIGFNPGLFHPTREGHTVYYRLLKELLKELLNDTAIQR